MRQICDAVGGIPYQVLIVPGLRNLVNTGYVTAI